MSKTCVFQTSPIQKPLKDFSYTEEPRLWKHWQKSLYIYIYGPIQVWTEGCTCFPKIYMLPQIIRRQKDGRKHCTRTSDILGVTVQNLVVRASWRPGFVHSCACVCVRERAECVVYIYMSNNPIFQGKKQAFFLFFHVPNSLQYQNIKSLILQ
jgi:hypothetical protein